MWYGLARVANFWLCYLSLQFRTRREVSCRETRNDHKLDVPLFKTAAGQKTFLYKTTTLWNNIDPALKLCNSLGGGGVYSYIQVLPD